MVRKKKSKPVSKEETKLSKDRAAITCMMAKDILHQDFIQYMKQRSQDIGENPQSIHFGRPEKYRSRDWQEKMERWHALTLGKQAEQSRKTMVGEHTIKEMAQQDQIFQRCCQITGMDPSRRQYSKWRRGFGGARILLRDALQSHMGTALVALRDHQEVLSNARSDFEKFDLDYWVGAMKDGWKIQARDNDVDYDEVISELVEHTENFEPPEDGSVEDALALFFAKKKEEEVTLNYEAAKETNRKLEETLETIEEERKRLLPQARGGAA